MDVIDYLAGLAFETPSNIPKNSLSITTLNNVLGVVFALAGGIAVAFIIFGGIKYITSQGDAADVAKAKNTILYSIIGLVVVVSSYFLISYVIGKF